MKIRNHSLLNKPLPRFFGIFVLIASLTSIFWLSRNVVLYDTKAALGNAPKDIQISNITPNSFTLTFITDSEVSATMSYGDSRTLEKVAFDIRDTKGPAPHRVHFITVNNLDPGKKYFYTITSGDGTFQNDTIPFEVSTPSVQEKFVASAKPILSITGKIIPDNNTILDDTLIVVNSDNTQSLSTLVSRNGNFEINLDNLYKKDLSGLMSLDSKSKLKLIATNGDQISTISFLLNQADPLPPIALAQNYDFTTNFTVPAIATQSADTTPFPIPTDVADQTPAILTPISNEEFTDQQPLFRGTAFPESDVEITIESSHQIRATVQANAVGIWEYRPERKIEPGDHTITVLALDNNGLIKSLNRSFTVFAEGSQFTQPSISPTPKTSPTPTPVISPTQPLPTPTSVPTPTSTSAPTISPTIPPTATPTEIVITPTTQATISVSPTAQITSPPVPEVGGSVLVIGIIGTLVAIVAGGLLFLLL